MRTHTCVMRIEAEEQVIKMNKMKDRIEAVTINMAKEKERALE